MRIQLYKIKNASKNDFTGKETVIYPCDPK